MSWEGGKRSVDEGVQMGKRSMFYTCPVDGLGREAPGEMEISEGSFSDGLGQPVKISV